MSGWSQRPLRACGAALLGTNAGIHAYLWQTGYRTLHVIGPSFLGVVVAASVVGLLLLVVPLRWLGLTALTGAAIEAATAGALLIAWRHGLFGFLESPRAPLFHAALITEGAGMLALLSLAALAIGRPEPRRRTVVGRA